MADIRWRLSYKGESYEFDATRDLTVARLRQAKNWFGAGYGQWANMLALLSAGDADAWAFAVWVCLKREGGPNVPRDPTFLDFPVGELMDSLVALDEEEDDGAERPTSEGGTTDSERTSTPSEPEPSGI